MAQDQNHHTALGQTTQSVQAPDGTIYQLIQYSDGSSGWENSSDPHNPHSDPPPAGSKPVQLDKSGNVISGGSSVATTAQGDVKPGYTQGADGYWRDPNGN